MGLASSPSSSSFLRAGLWPACDADDLDVIKSYETSWHATRMARKLKSYQTSLGFYDFAIAVPSMKAALEAWGAEAIRSIRGSPRRG